MGTLMLLQLVTFIALASVFSVAEDDEKVCISPEVAKNSGCQPKKGHDCWPTEYPDKSTTIRGRKCQNWRYNSPHQQPYTKDWRNLDNNGKHNLCRNPDNMAGPWCYTTDPKVRWEYCFHHDLAECSNGKDDCITPKVAEESGCQAKKRDDCFPTAYPNKTTTITGRTCQSWRYNKPHSHPYAKDWRDLDGSAKHNFCRNPDNSDGPWCYTMDPDKRWEYCFHHDPAKCSGGGDCISPAVAEASDCQPKRGDKDCFPPAYPDKDTTITGRKCQGWRYSRPHKSNYVVDYRNLDNRGKHSFCRNPDGSAGPWCYTMDPDVRWEYCFHHDESKC